MTVVESEVLILGAGLTGLSAAAAYGPGAVVVEQEDRPGGLVRTECFDGWWFDRVIHLLHLSDPATQAWVRELLGDTLVACPPQAWIDTAAGTVRYPFQLHLSGLEPAARERCLADFAEAARGPDPADAAHYAELLERAFGRGMCEEFFLPYNAKMWRRPLAGLAPSGFQWNLTRPSLAEVERGACGTDGSALAYNSNGWYPRPPAGSPVRGMEVLTSALADRVCDLRTSHRVVRIDPARRSVWAEHEGRTVCFRYRRACVSTIALPRTVELCRDVPDPVREDARRLVWNRVRSVALSVCGPRPRGTGHWRYYPDPRLPFTRLVFMTEFDPATAPPHGWGLLAEVPERAEERPGPDRDLADAVWRAVAGTGVLPAGSRLAASHVMTADPAYVVFTPQNRAAMERVRACLSASGITPLGRYGHWEYSSMERALSDGLHWGRSRRGTPLLSGRAPAP
uniref:Putative amine oxidase n=1 Tax=Streptomyces sp. MMG1612 TaxID=1415547 RepID=U5YNX6_9ACTN|nr:putative amine oxidase [Streptomyces sp. MMG1612]